jgi:hypothetical protein
MLANPFRYNSNADLGSLFLVHAVMAISCHHIDAYSPEKVFEHRQTALNLFREHLAPHNVVQNRYSLLDTIVILFSLDVSFELQWQ